MGLVKLLENFQLQNTNLSCDVYRRTSEQLRFPDAGFEIIYRNPVNCTNRRSEQQKRDNEGHLLYFWLFGSSNSNLLQ